MNARPGKVMAALLWLSIGCSAQALAAACDVDNDGDVDRVDLKMIASANNAPADGLDDPRDADGDGVITMDDLSLCIRQCSLTGCGILDPASPAPVQDAAPPNTAGTAPVEKVINGGGKPGSTLPGQPGNAVQGRVIVGGTQWKVGPGDTLYSIGRSVFPRDSGKQARLRRDIISLNPSVFVDGADYLAVGAVLELPAYVDFENAVAGADQPRPTALLKADVIVSSKLPRPADSGSIGEPVTVKPRAPGSVPLQEPKSSVGAGIKSDPVATGKKSTSTRDQAKANASVSLGYSYGGDNLADADGSGDLHGGAGAHLRLGFEQLPRHGSGFRLALGLQYNLLQEGGESTTFRDAYLQWAYHYGSHPLVYGIGVVIHTGPTLKQATTREFDPAAGVLVYMENAGNGVLSGWGLSYTSLQLDEQGVDESVDASRAELYYTWRF